MIKDQRIRKSDFFFIFLYVLVSFAIILKFIYILRDEEHTIDFLIGFLAMNLVGLICFIEIRGKNENRKNSTE